MSTLAEQLRDIAHELPNDRSDVLLAAADKLEEKEA